METKVATIKKISFERNDKGTIEAELVFDSNDKEYRYKNNDFYSQNNPRRRPARYDFHAKMGWIAYVKGEYGPNEKKNWKTVRIRTDGDIVHEVGHISEDIWLNLPQEQPEPAESGLLFMVQVGLHVYDPVAKEAQDVTEYKMVEFKTYEEAKKALLEATDAALSVGGVERSINDLRL